jgi:lipoate-protein ligase A
MANRFEILTGKIPESNPDRLEVAGNLAMSDLAQIVVQKFHPVDGDVFFISHGGMTTAGTKSLKDSFQKTLEGLDTTCGIVVSSKEFKITKESFDKTKIEIQGEEFSEDEIRAMVITAMARAKGIDEEESEEKLDDTFREVLGE